MVATWVAGNVKLLVMNTYILPSSALKVILRNFNRKTSPLVLLYPIVMYCSFKIPFAFFFLVLSVITLVTWYRALSFIRVTNQIFCVVHFANWLYRLYALSKTIKLLVGNSRW